MTVDVSGDTDIAGENYLDSDANIEKQETQEVQSEDCGESCLWAEVQHHLWQLMRLHQHLFVWLSNKRTEIVKQTFERVKCYYIMLWSDTVLN